MGRLNDAVPNPAPVDSHPAPDAELLTRDRSLQTIPPGFTSAYLQCTGSLNEPLRLRPV